MKFSLFAALLLPVTPLWAAPPKVAPQPVIEKEAALFLERAAQKLRALKSLSGSAIVTAKSARGVARHSIVFRSQPGKRLAVILRDIQPISGPKNVVTTLFDGTDLITSLNGQTATRDNYARFLEAEEILSRLSARSPVLSFGPPFLAGAPIFESKRRQPKASFLRRLSLEKRRDATQITLVFHPPKKPPITHHYLFDSQTLALKTMTIQSVLEKKPATLTAKFSALVSNWKGSQKLTDAQVYSWKSLAPTVALAQKPEGDIVFDPNAVAIMEGARALYSKTPTIYMEMKIADVLYSDEPEAKPNGRLAFDAKGFLRIENLDFLHSLVLQDGKHVYQVANPDFREEMGPTYTKKDFVPGDAASEAVSLLAVGYDLLVHLGDWRSGENPFAPQTAKFKAEAINLRRASLQIVGQGPFNGRPCDFVRYSELDEDGQTTQETFWISRPARQIERYQKSVSQNGELESRDDFQIIKQTLASPLDPKLFVFQAPKGAKLVKE